MQTDETNDEPSVLDGLRPELDISMPAWVASLEHAIQSDEAINAFRQETGETWEPGKSPLEQMIDDATGKGRDVCRKFVEWHNAAIWGLNPNGKPMDVI